jgi:hypothetical protein
MNEIQANIIQVIQVDCKNLAKKNSYDDIEIILDSYTIQKGG